MLNIAQRASTTFVPHSIEFVSPQPLQAESNPGATPPSTALAPQRQTDLATQLADKENLKSLGQKLQQVATRLGNEAQPQDVLAALRSTAMDIHPGSSYAEEAGSRATLEAFITNALGLPLPSSHFHLEGLAISVTNRSLEHPLGDLGGALSWPVPLDTQEQQQLLTFTLNQEHALGDNPRVSQTPGGMLEFLRYRQPIAVGPQDDPARVLEALLGTPQAQQVGKDLQEKMQGLATDSSATDYLLAAIILQMDPQSINSPQRNLIAGFDLANQQHWGKPVSAVVDGLVAHLIKERITSPEMAKVGAHLLLASRAPAFLIKDIPSSVTYGSLAWVNLAVAAATIEARSPGSVPNMTFTQVMLEAENAGLADPLVTQAAQREALIDWGVANGVLGKKDDHLYTADELRTLVSTFNARKAQMASAAQHLDKDIPSRKALAWAVLKERFPELEPIFEKRLIHVNRGERDAHGRIDGYRTVEIGPHSLLDIAMMDLPGPDLVFNADDDTRIPVEQLNANPHFGVTDQFDTQFKTVITEKKPAIATYIKHLIAQLPVQDRKNFELGEITFYQKHSKSLSTGFFGSTPNPKAEELLLKIKHGDVEAEYKIDFNAGRIETLRKGAVAPGSYRASNRIYETKEFEPAGSDILREPGAAPLDGSPIDTFAWDRVQRIADAFVEHINLDDDTLKQQARGQTTADKNHARADAVHEFLLDLIPFRSAINNFHAGNIGDGIIDFGMDLFGFMTAGAATAGKVAKIAGTAASHVSKGLRAARAIGMATFSTLNPLGGLGDAAVGTVRLAGKGLEFLGAKGAKVVNALRGTTGSYDLLKTLSKDYGVVATGSLKVGNRSIESAAVFKDGHWYAFDANTSRAYGSPIQGFTPNTVATKGELNQSITDWFYKKLAGETASAPASPTVLGRYVPADFENALKDVKAKVASREAFDFGYANGKPENVPGYAPDMGLIELQSLASQKFVGPEDLGALAKQIERQKIKLTHDGFTLFQNDIRAAGGTVTPMPQEFYLSLVNLASQGECAGMANALALALMSGTETTFLRNMYTAAGQLVNGKKLGFIDDLTAFHKAVSGVDTFHMGKPVRQLSYRNIADELTEAVPPKVLRIATQDHALLAGVVMRDDKPVWFYFDPNFGLAQFPSAEAMRNGLERTLNRGTSPFQHRAHGETPGAPEYRVSDFDIDDMASYANYKAVNQMTLVELTP